MSGNRLTDGLGNLLQDIAASAVYLTDKLLSALGIGRTPTGSHPTGYKVTATKINEPRDRTP